MIDLLQKGGPLMWVLLFCSIVALAVFAERMFHYHRAQIDVGEFLQGLAALIRRRNLAEALHESAATPGPVARVIHAALLHHEAPRAELRDIIQESGQLEVPKLEDKLPILGMLAFAAPLLGLLGTVLGLLDIFMKLSAASGYVTAADISGGMYQSLLTTAAGLGIGIAAHVGHSYLSAWVNSLLHDMERGGIEVLHLLTEPRANADIIEFHGRHARPAARDESRP